MNDSTVSVMIYFHNVGGLYMYMGDTRVQQNLACMYNVLN